MANSKFEYVRRFERDEILLPNTYTVVRLDGRGFHQFSKAHHFAKPNDERALLLMNCCARNVMKEYADIVVAYGQSDEYSFVLKRSAQLYQRRVSKLVSVFASLFASHYVHHWPTYFPDQPLLYPPCFDARTVSYPTDQNLKDYLAWRQADCHINNLYNTCFWALVLQGGRTEQEAEEDLKGTLAADKNELLFTRFHMNYNALPEFYRKGSVLVRRKVDTEELSKTSGEVVVRKRPDVVIEHVDMIGEQFWQDNEYICKE